MIHNAAISEKNNMKIAYLILAHKNPEQLSCLINQIKTDDVYFFIHIDIKSRIEDFQNETNKTEANIKYISNRKNGQWGDFGIVQATLNLINEAASTSFFDYYILLSGMDFPIKKNSDIINFLNANNGKSFISYSKMPLNELNYGGLDRVTGYSYTINKKRQTFVPFRLKPKFNFKGHVLNILLGLVSLPKGRRKPPKEIKCFYYGSQWWMLHKTTINYILEFLGKNPDYLAFHNHTLIPDEIFFQTILLNHSNHNELGLINNNYRYMCWQPSSDHPKILGMEDSDSLLNTPDLFARKFEFESAVLEFTINNVLK